MSRPAVRFGTDGVRGVANRDLTPEIALAIGRAAVGLAPGRPVLIGCDTRRSGAMLAAAVAAGVCSEGADAVQLGVVPTPAVALASKDADAVGVMISASHNPFADNGIKLFAPGGRKLADVDQAAVESAIAAALESPHAPGPTGGDVGLVRADDGALDRYADAVVAALDGRDLRGLHLVVDTANGSNHEVAPRVLRGLGATVDVLADDPDGTNINDSCGSTHPEQLQSAVVAAGADAGIAFDGDADRVLAVSADGELVDGDQILALCAVDLRDRGRLHADTVVVTVMSNLGFRHAMRDAGIDVVETAVGDRYVLEAMADGGFSLGGEQSGHVIFGDLATTGDGLLTAVMLLDLVRRSGQTLESLTAASMARLPQVLENVRLTSPMPDVVDRVAAEIAEAADLLGERGRVLLRPSGTEPVVRVMVEAPTADEAQTVADRLAEAVRRLG